MSDDFVPLADAHLRISRVLESLYGEEVMRTCGHGLGDSVWITGLNPDRADCRNCYDDTEKVPVREFFSCDNCGHRTTGEAWNWPQFAQVYQPLASMPGYRGRVGWLGARMCLGCSKRRRGDFVLAFQQRQVALVALQLLGNQPVLLSDEARHPDARHTICGVHPTVIGHNTLDLCREQHYRNECDMCGVEVLTMRRHGVIDFPDGEGDLGFRVKQEDGALAVVSGRLIVRNLAAVCDDCGGEDGFWPFDGDEEMVPRIVVPNDRKAFAQFCLESYLRP